jgi:hypothetical protein
MAVLRCFRLCVLTGLLSLTGLAVNAQGKTFAFSGVYTGTITLTPTSPTTYHGVISGTGSSSPVSLTNLFGTYDLDLADLGPSGAYAEDVTGSLTNAAGDRLFSLFDATVTPTSPTTAALTQDFLLTGGTGFYAGAT